jgi:hypothetical protein
VGIRKKIKAQVDYFKQIGSLEAVTKENNAKAFGSSLIEEKLLFWFRLWHQYREKRFDIVYIRDLTVLSGVFEYIFLRRIKAKLVLVEVPTYPVSSNMKGLKWLIYFWNQIVRRITWRFLIDEIIYNGNETNRIHGIRALRINHFVGLEKTRLSVPNQNPPIFAVISSYQVYHGLDRIIDSFTSSCAKASLYVIGGTSEQILDYSKKYNHDERINFYPFLENGELDRVLCKVGIGISSMGLYKVGLSGTSGLKVAEYASRGLHIVLGYSDDTFMDKLYTFAVENDSSEIPFEAIVNWYMKSKVNPSDIRIDILKEASWFNYIQRRVSLTN